MTPMKKKKLNGDGLTATSSPLVDTCQPAPAVDTCQLTNSPESDWLAPEEKAVFDIACEAVTLFKRTFETWVVIGRAVVIARQIANRQNDPKAFLRVIEQQGLAPIVDKATASRLEKIMANLEAIEKWRATLTESERYKWAAPTTILKRCPALQTNQKGNKPLSPMARLKQQNEELTQANMTLQEDLHKVRPRWQPDDGPEVIATALIDQLSRQKARKVAEQVLVILKRRRAA